MKQLNTIFVGRGKKYSLRRVGLHSVAVHEILHVQVRNVAVHGHGWIRFEDRASFDRRFRLIETVLIHVEVRR